ncbi:hypothetical protein SteCoe_21242 [Stentor coeruleus]|uniref:PIPK domain-containing protein n=1 Tax=Stentor coeruleus TaxID=5963 RepID=A0A1R2BPX1_9CILI|nr:hypothetical protein SteCoe_21242 [Stentor coeruleus]
MFIWLIPVALFFVAISTVCEVLLIIGYFKIPQMKKHPGFFILAQSIAQLYIDIHWITIINSVRSSLDDSACRILGSFNFYSFVIAWSYTLFLSLEVYLKMSRPVSQNPSKRNKIYFVIAQVSALIPAIVLLISNQNGRSALGTCSIENQSSYNILWALNLLINAPLCVYFCARSLWISRKKSIQIKSGLKYHLYVVLVFTLSMAPGQAFDAINWYILESSNSQIKDWAANLAALIGCMSGTMIFAARVSQKNILRSLWNVLLNRKIKFTSFSHKVSLLTYHRYFDFLDKDMIVKNTVLCLHLVFENTPEEFPEIFEEDKKWKFDVMGVECYVNQYRYNCFARVFKSEKLSKSSLLLSFDADLNLNDFQSRYKAIDDINFTFLTHDSKYFIKSISKSNLNFLCNLSKKYTDRQIEDDSYLLAIYGLFSIEFKNTACINFIVYEKLGYELKDHKKAVLVGNSRLGHPLVIDFYANRNSIIGTDIEYVRLPRIQLRKIIKSIEIDTLVLSMLKDTLYYLKIVYTEEIVYLQNKKKHLLFDGNAAYMGIFMVWNQIEKIKPQEYRAQFLKDFNSAFLLESF